MGRVSAQHLPVFRITPIEGILKVIEKTRREQVALLPAVLLAGLKNYFFLVAAFAFALGAAAFALGAAFFFVAAKSFTSFR